MLVNANIVDLWRLIIYNNFWIFEFLNFQFGYIDMNLLADKFIRRQIFYYLWASAIIVSTITGFMDIVFGFALALWGANKWLRWINNAAVNMIKDIAKNQKKGFNQAGQP